MALQMQIDLKKLPPYARILIAVVPSVILAVAMLFIAILPKQKQIKTLNATIDDQSNKIAASQAKVAKLDTLIRENEQLVVRLKELKEYLPEEKEVSGLLKQVSDLSGAAGLDMKSWRPNQKKAHPSGIVYEIPVAIAVTGNYHDFARFLASLTRMSRIVNVDNIVFSPSAGKGGANLQIAFTATTFSSIPEGETPK